MAVNHTGRVLERFLEAAPDEPAVMLNLLRFTDGGEDSDESYLTHFRDEALVEAVLQPVTNLPLPADRHRHTGTGTT